MRDRSCSCPRASELVDPSTADNLSIHCPRSPKFVSILHQRLDATPPPNHLRIGSGVIGEHESQLVGAQVRRVMWAWGEGRGWRESQWLVDASG